MMIIIKQKSHQLVGFLIIRSFLSLYLSLCIRFSIQYELSDASDMNLRVIHNHVHRRNDGLDNNQQCQ